MQNNPRSSLASHTRAMAANCSFTYLDGSNVEDPVLRAGLAALLQQVQPQLMFHSDGLFLAARTDDVDAAR